MTHRAPLPDELGATFSSRAARDAGVPKNRLSAEDLARPFHGARLRLTPEEEAESRRRRVRGRNRSPNRDQGQDPHRDQDPDPSRDPFIEADHDTAHQQRQHPAEIWRRTQLELAQVYRTIMPAHQFFTGRTAAALLGLPVDARDSDALEVAVHAPLSPPRRAGVLGSQIHPVLAHAVDARGYRLLSPADLWASLAPGLALRDRVSLGDAIVRIPRIPGGFKPPPIGSLGTRGPLATVAELAQAAEAHRRRGRPQLMEALSLLRTGSSSPPESHLRLALIAHGLPEPELDYDVYDEHGRLLGCSELAYPDCRLAIEYEGDGHRVSRAQWNRDIEKYRDYADLGWEVVRVTSHLLYRREQQLASRVRTLLIHRGRSKP